MPIMKTITIQVKPEIAQAYQRFNPEKKAKIKTLLELLLQQELDNRSLAEVMDEIGYQAQARGLTPEILAESLADES
jgi:ubiquinone biosynthesis protein COQ9